MDNNWRNTKKIVAGTLWKKHVRNVWRNCLGNILKEFTDKFSWKHPILEKYWRNPCWNTWRGPCINHWRNFRRNRWSNCSRNTAKFKALIGFSLTEILRKMSDQIGLFQFNWENFWKKNPEGNLLKISFKTLGRLPTCCLEESPKGLYDEFLQRSLENS